MIVLDKVPPVTCFLLPEPLVEAFIEKTAIVAKNPGLQDHNVPDISFNHIHDTIFPSEFFPDRSGKTTGAYLRSPASSSFYQ